MYALFIALTLAGGDGLADAQPSGKPPSPIARPLLVPPMPLRPGPPPPPPFAPPRRARANLNEYFVVDDYPPAALRAHAQGITGVTLTIGLDGRVAACVVTISSGSGALDEATCRILTSRARYAPARDNLTGNPAIGRDYGRIIWRLPGN